MSRERELPSKGIIGKQDMPGRMVYSMNKHGQPPLPIGEVSTGSCIILGEKGGDGALAIDQLGSWTAPVIDGSESGCGLLP